MSSARVPRVSIILLNLNGYEDTRDCLESLGRLNYENAEIIVVDNGSTDGSGLRLLQEFPNIRLLRSEHNIGFTGGNNLGMDDAIQRGTEYVLLLNNDTLVDSEFLKLLIEVGQSNPQIGVLGPKIYYASDPNRIWYAGGEVKWGNPDHFALGQVDDGVKFCAVVKTGFISGCALLAKVPMLQRIGLLDEKLFVYHEDTDFCARAQKAGYTCTFVPQAHIWHKISRTCGRESTFTLYLSTRNQLAWIVNHTRFPKKPVVLSYVFAKKLAKMLLLLGSGRWSSGAAVFAGVRAFVQGVYGPPGNLMVPNRQAQRPINNAAKHDSNIVGSVTSEQ